MTDWRVILMQGGELVSYSNDMLARHFVVVIYLYIKLFSILLPKNMISHNIKKKCFLCLRVIPLLDTLIWLLLMSTKAKKTNPAFSILYYVGTYISVSFRIHLNRNSNNFQNNYDANNQLVQLWICPQHAYYHLMYV